MSLSQRQRNDWTNAIFVLKTDYSLHSKNRIIELLRCGYWQLCFSLIFLVSMFSFSACEQNSNLNIYLLWSDFLRLYSMTSKSSLPWEKSNDVRALPKIKNIKYFYFRLTLVKSRTNIVEATFPLRILLTLNENK